MVLSATAEERAGDADDTRAVDFEVALEGSQEEFRLLAVADRGVAEVEAKLAVRVGGFALLFGEESAFGLVLPVEGCAGERGVEHELVELGVVGHGVLDGLVDSFWGVLRQAHDARAQDADAVGLEGVDQRARVGPFSFTSAPPSAPPTQEMPRPTISSMLYSRSVFAELNTYSDHAFACSRISSSSRKARLRCSRKFSSMTKKARTRMARSSSRITPNSSSPVS
jgi:hypothetical protein